MTFLHAIFLILLLLTMAGTLTDLRRREAYPVIYWMVVALFFFLSFLRWERGYDWGPYFEFFERVAGVDPDVSFESGFQWLNWQVKELTGSYTVMLLIQSAVIYACVGTTTWRYSSDPLFSIFVIFSLTFADIYFVRQAVAIVICFYSFRFIVARRFWPFLLFVFFASQFHVTAWVFLFAYFLWRVELSDRQLIVIMAASAGVSLLLSETILALFGSLGGAVGDKIAYYLDAGSDPTVTAGGGHMTMHGLLIRGFSHRAFIFVLALWALGKTRRRDKVLNAVFNIYMFSIVLYSLTAPLSVVLARVANYYDYFLMLVIPSIVTSLTVRSNRVIVFLILAGYLFVRFQGLFDTRPEFFVPYRSIFNKELVI